MKNRTIILLIFIPLIASCANKNSNTFVLRNTLPENLSQSITKICANSKMDKDSTKMIPVKGFDFESKHRVNQNQIDTSMNIIDYPINIYLESFFEFNAKCKSENTVSIDELRTYVDYNGYGMGVYAITYKLEAIVSSNKKGSLMSSDYYWSFSESDNLGMFSSENKEIEYQSVALTSAFYNLYQNILQSLNE